jgi:hypothetical protein
MQDKYLTKRKQVPPLFSYFIAKPKKSILANKPLLKHYQEIEDIREEKSHRRYGVYSDSQYFVLMAHHLWGRLIKGCRNLSQQFCVNRSSRTL